jgi:hypothetical protein
MLAQCVLLAWRAYYYNSVSITNSPLSPDSKNSRFGMVPASYSFRGQRCFPLEALMSDLKLCVQCALLAVAYLPPSLAMASTSIYSWSGFQAKPRHHLSQRSSTRRFLSGGAVSSEAVHHLRFPSSPPSRISPLFLRPSSLRPRPRGPFPRLRSHRGVSSGGLLGKGERTSMRKRKNRKTNMR